MSGRNKKLRKQVIGQMLAKQISVPEARARITWLRTGRYQPPQQAPAVAKSARPAPQPVPAWVRELRLARQVLSATYTEPSDPVLREGARAMDARRRGGAA
jgi:hypothetical protein